MDANETKRESTNFIHKIIDEDIANGLTARIHTRFPPEPNGYLHIGHTKAIWIGYSTAKKYNGLFNLRFDDTNPSKEGDEYVQAIQDDLKWLGVVPDKICFGSDYFDQCYEFALKLIKDGKAFVCDLSKEEIEKYRGTLTTPGTESPYRNRSVEENLDLFTRMKNGEFPDGSKTLRAKIDMSSPNINMRDPVIYRILRAPHHRTGTKWCIYPLYDYAHPIQDALEGITHSLCDVEFENHRPLYEWVVNSIDFEQKPKQREFAKLNITYTKIGKRYSKALIEQGIADGWDDPRLPTLRALKRRGYSPSAIFNFVQLSGISKAMSLCDYGLLEHCIREELNTTVPRKMAVLDPVEVEITNFEDEKVEYFDVANNPTDENAGTRKVAFTKHLYIEREDFSDNPPPKYQRLKKDCEVRFMGAYVVKCNEVIYGQNGEIEKLLCTVDPDTAGKNPSDGRKIKGTIHWVSKDFCEDYEVRLYDKLFTCEDTVVINMDNFKDYLNPDSLKVMKNAKVEKSIEGAKPGDKFQFVRNGYFCIDLHNDRVINRIVTLKDSFAKK